MLYILKYTFEKNDKRIVNINIELVANAKPVLIGKVTIINRL